MSFLQAFSRGVRLTTDHPTLVFLLWLTNLLLVLPMGVLMVQALEEEIGPSLVHERLRAGFDLDWYGEVESSATGLMETFQPSAVMGDGALLDNLEGLVTGSLSFDHPTLAGLVVLYLLVWILLQGGVLARFHDPLGQDGLRGFLAGGGDLFFRLLRLALLGLPLYYGIFRLSGWGMGWITRATRDTTRESTVLLYVLLVSGLTVLLLGFVRMVLDYARVAIVVENRRSALGALFRGLGFVLGRPGKAVALTLLGGFLLLVLVVLFIQVAPGVGASSVLAVLFAFLLGQGYILLRMALRITLLGAELELYRSERSF